VARRSDPEEPQGRKRHKYAESDDDEDEDKPTAVKSPRTEFSLVQRLERAPLSGTRGGRKRWGDWITCSSEMAVQCSLCTNYLLKI
jgi:hypothetical protein